jgi:hypothetical protein
MSRPRSRRAAGRRSEFAPRRRVSIARWSVQIRCVGVAGVAAQILLVAVVSGIERHQCGANRLPDAGRAAVVVLDDQDEIEAAVADDVFRRALPRTTCRHRRSDRRCRSGS